MSRLDLQTMRIGRREVLLAIFKPTPHKGRALYSMQALDPSLAAAQARATWVIHDMLEQEDALHNGL